MTETLFPPTENAIVKAAIALVATARSTSTVRAKSEAQPWRSTRQMMKKYNLSVHSFKVKDARRLLSDGSLCSIGGMTLEHKAVKRDGKKRLRHFWRETGGSHSSGTASAFISEVCKTALLIEGGVS